MKQSRNKPLPFFKGKYYNTQKGEKKNSFFFFLPSIIKSHKMFLNWDIMMFSIFIGFLRYYIQINIFQSIKKTNTNILQEDIDKLIKILHHEKLHVDLNDKKSKETLLMFLDKNSHIILLLKNSNENHPYIRKVIGTYFKDLNFVSDYKS